MGADRCAKKKIQTVLKLLRSENRIGLAMAMQVEAITAGSRRVPPGPAAKYDSAEDLFRWMNENFVLYGDIYRASVFGSEVYVVSAPDYCERILRRNWRNYSRNGQVVKRISLLLGNGLIASNGEFWAGQRRMIQPAFLKDSIGGLVDNIVKINAALLDKWKAAARLEEQINVTHDVSRLILKITLTAIFGADYDTVAPYFDILAGESARNFAFAVTFRPLGRIIVDLAERRRRTGTFLDDLLAKLMQARDRENGEPMPDAQLAKEVMTLIVAGHETTASLLNWMWYLLATHPESQERLAQELDRSPWDHVPAIDALSKYSYARQVIDEALRLYPPLWLMTRKALHDDQLGDFFVPAGTEIYISPYLVQRSPSLWPVPDRFDPDRMSADRVLRRHELAFCPFGAGPRNCIGELMARVEAQIHLIMFVRELRLLYKEDKPVEVTAGMNLLSKHDFIMTPERRTLRG
jgi:cytochrome P450